MSKRSESRAEYERMWDALPFECRQEAVLQSIAGGRKSDGSQWAFSGSHPVDLGVWTSESVEKRNFFQEDND
jgi:hypothetical protein